MNHIAHTSIQRPVASPFLGAPRSHLRNRKAAVREGIDEARQFVHAHLPGHLSRELAAFLCDVFADDEAVAAYMQPVRGHRAENEPKEMQLVVHESRADADRAWSYPGLLNRLERELAAVTAFVSRCAGDLLDDALRQLRRKDCVLGQTLGEVLGQNCGEDVDRQQVLRIRATIRACR